MPPDAHKRTHILPRSSRLHGGTVVTWLKLDDEFDDECLAADLSESACWTHVQGLLFAMRHNTGGAITDRQFKRFAETKEPARAAQQLVDAGFWRRTAGGFVVVHHMDKQPTPEQVAARKAADAARQSKARQKRADDALAKAGSRHESRRDNTRDYGSGRDGSGQGGALEEEDSQEADVIALAEWPVVQAPGAGAYSR